MLFASRIEAFASFALCAERSADQDQDVTATEFAYRQRFWILLGIYIAAFACWPLDRRDVSGALTKLLPRTELGAELGFLVAAVLVAVAAGIFTWSSGESAQGFATWLCWVGFGLLLNRLGFAMVVAGVGIAVYRLGGSSGGGWRRGLPVWIAAAALLTLACTRKELLFFLVLTFALLVRTVLLRGGKRALLTVALLQTPLSGQVITAQYDNARTGAVLHERSLTPQNVCAKRFGKLFSLRVEGDIYAQPLYLPRVDVPGQGKHNVLFVATEHDTVAAFDADGKTTEAFWRVSFIRPEEHVTTVPPIDLRCPFIRPEVGITATPVIERRSGTLYVVARTKENGQYVQRLHALDVRTGAEKSGGPVVIRAAVAGRAGRIEFDPLRENPRAALLLVRGLIYITWASSCDVGPYHGWIMAYEARTLSQRAVFNTSSDGAEAGIWLGDAGPAADRDGNLFFVTGNGDLSASGREHDFGQSVLKLSYRNRALAVDDFFTPDNAAKLNAQDADLGSSGPVLLPDNSLVVAGKGEGPIYVLDRDSLRVKQTVPGMKDCFGAPGYWNQHVYYVCEGDVLKDFRWDGVRLSVLPVTEGSHKFKGAGVIPVISANGAADAVVWLVETPSHFTADAPAVLRAFDAQDVRRELYSSEQGTLQNPARDRAGEALRFSIPTVANGKVYVGTKGEVDVYGLLVRP